MKHVTSTEHLSVFQTEPFHAPEAWGDVPLDAKCHRVLFVAFERDSGDEPQRKPALTALFTVLHERDGSYWHFLEWLETSRYYSDEWGQVFRDEFMEALEEIFPGHTAEPETQEREDGSVYYLDTLDGLDIEDAVCT